jgi:hypothetical protein
MAIRIWATLTIAAGAALAIIRAFAVPVAQMRAEWLGDIAFGLVFALPGVLAWLGLDRPALLAAAGVLACCMSIVALSGIALPLLIPGVAFFVGAARRRDPSRFLGRSVLAAGVAVVAGLAGMAVLVLPRNEFCWSKAIDARGHVTYDTSSCGAANGPYVTESGTTDGFVTWQQGVEAIACAAGGLGAGTALAKRGRLSVN